MSRALSLKVAAVERETDDAVTIHLKQPLLRRIRYEAGQYLTLEFDVEGNGSKGCRAYSISSTPGLDKTLAITVKRVAGGQVSNRLVGQLAAGDRVQALGAHGRFTFSPQPGQGRHIVLFAAGSGISPIFSILRSALHFEADARVTLIYGNRNAEAVIFGDKIEALQREFAKRLKVIHVFSQPNRPCLHSGRLNRVMVVEILRALPGFELARCEFYTCGPSGMMDEVTAALDALEVRREAIHLECFTPKQTQRPVDASAPKQVSLLLQGQEHRFVVPAGQSILDAALANGLQPPFSCRSGFCTACVCTRLEGEIAMREDHGLSPAELKMGQALMCIGYPISEQVRLKVD